MNKSKKKKKITFKVCIFNWRKSLDSSRFEVWIWALNNGEWNVWLVCVLERLAWIYEPYPEAW